ncbi:MAG: UbiA family prenyltransferase [Pseudomonadales bacterium]
MNARVVSKQNAVSKQTVISKQREGLARALLVYQRERFPLLAYVPLVAAFTLSAALYSSYAAGWPSTSSPTVLDLAFGGLTILCIFLLMRIADEFKDAQDDARYRPYRPVPRGLVTLKQLGWLAAIIVALIVSVHALGWPHLLPALSVILIYLGLMSVEFGARGWLRVHPMTYAATHMVILVLIAAYASGLGGGVGSPGVWMFLALSYTNGFVLEIGRKIRKPHDEEVGVDTYSALYGVRRAVTFWSVAIIASTAFALIALHGLTTFPLPATMLVAGAFACLAIGRRHPGPIETLSGLWLLASYLIVGTAPILDAWLIAHITS